MVSASQFCPQCGASNQLQSRFCAQCGTSLQTATTSSPTGRLQTDYLLGQRYRVLKLLGQGGMGAVYQAKDLRFRGALRAVKEMSQNGLSPQELQETTEAFEREALILARLQHANLPRIYDHFREQGRWYLVMDYLEGETLEDRLNRLPNHPCTFAETLRISLQLCTVLDYLHTRTPPIIFRDLKPANIMLAQNDTIYLIDFGIARFFKTGQAKDTVALGSPGYAAPEQYGRAQTTPSSDIYSLGATMHHMLSGHDPSNDPFQFPDLQLDYQPGSSELTALIMQMVEMKREKRPASVAEVQQKLQTLYDQLPLNNAPSQTITISPLPVQPQRPAPPTRPPDNTNALVVDQSGAGHFYTLTEALQHASEGQPITVRPGYYHEQLVLQKNVEIVGDGPVEQIILAFTDASCIMMQTASATIHGLTIRCHEKETRQFYAIDIPTGQLCLEDCDISAEAQAGIFIHTEEANPTIRRCRIHDCSGDGIFVADKGKGTLKDCDISGNKGTGLTLTNDANPIVRHCRFYNSASNGIYIYGQGRGLIEDCSLSGHTWSAVAIEEGSDPQLRDCKIYTGKGSGIYICKHGCGTIDHCEIYENEQAGIVIVEEGRPLIRQCQIHHNRQGGFYIHSRGKGVIEACDIFDNINAEVIIGTAGSPLIRQCIIHGSMATGVHAQKDALGAIEHCRLYSNRRTWELHPTSRLTRSFNREG